MGYTTDFEGSVTVTPPLNAEEAAFLNKFSETRRMNRANGPYFVGGTGDFGQGQDADVIDHNGPPEGQPGLWCQWVVSEDGSEISWDGGEKFYCADEWMAYIVEHFIGPDPVAKQVDPDTFYFLKGHTIEGEIRACGEESDDLWKIEVRDSVVTRIEGHVAFGPADADEPTEPDPHRVRCNEAHLASTVTLIKQAREAWDTQTKDAPDLHVKGLTFEIFLRDLEEAAGIR